MKRQHLSAGLTVLTLFASTACSPDAGVERQQTGSGGSGASGGGGAGAGSGGVGTGGGGTSAGSSGSGGVASGAGGVAGSAGNGAGGTAGSTGGSAGAAGAGGSPGVGCTGTELFCEDFEDDTEGMAPGSPWLPKAESCQYQSTFSSEVTTELANNGTKSFKATNKSNPDCRISAPFPDADEFWLRAFIQWETSADFAEKETLALDLHGPSGLKTDDPALRFGTRTKAPCTGSPGPQITIMAVAGGEQTGCNGTLQEPKGKWYCFEAHVTQSSVLSVKTYIDGAAFTYESEGKAATDVIETPAGVPLKEKMNHVRLGIFSTGNFNGNVYIDDLAISTTRLNCGK